MLIPLGILASSRNGGAGSFDLISTTILGSSAASVTFDVTGLGSTYKHLQVRAMTSLSSDVVLRMRLNGVSTSSYARHLLYGNGSSVTSTANTGETYMSLSLTSSNEFGASVTDILDAFSSSKTKTVRTLGGVAGGTKYVNLNSNLYTATGAITSLTLFPDGGTMNTGTRFSIYGIKG
jgi:hypothetical protein